MSGSYEIVRASPTDYPMVMDLLDRSFGHGTGGFERLMPHLYSGKEEIMHHHYAIRNKHRFVAALGLFPLRITVGDSCISARGVGSVCTDPKHRNNGLMGMLLNRAIARARNEGVELIWLGGQRQRYRRAGWEKAGCRWHAVVAPQNFPQRFPGAALIKLQELEEFDSHLLRHLCDLHDLQAIHCDRSVESLWKSIQVAGRAIFIAYSTLGDVVGYVITYHDQRFVVELVGRDAETELAILYHVTNQAPASQLTVIGSSLECPLQAWLIRNAESLSIHNSENWLILDWLAVVRAFLTLRARRRSLPCGEVSLGIDGEPRSLLMRVAGGTVEVEWRECAPSVVLGATEATQLLFGPLRPSDVRSLPVEASILDAWCPLPLMLPYHDKV